MLGLGTRRDGGQFFSAVQLCLSLVAVLLYFSTDDPPSLDALRNYRAVPRVACACCWFCKAYTCSELAWKTASIVLRFYGIRASCHYAKEYYTPITDTICFLVAALHFGRAIKPHAYSVDLSTKNSNASRIHTD